MIQSKFPLRCYKKSKECEGDCNLASKFIRFPFYIRLSTLWFLRMKKFATRKKKNNKSIWSDVMIDGDEAKNNENELRIERN